MGCESEGFSRTIMSRTKGSRSEDRREARRRRCEAVKSLGSIATKASGDTYRANLPGARGRLRSFGDLLRTDNGLQPPREGDGQDSHIKRTSIGAGLAPPQVAWVPLVDPFDSLSVPRRCRWNRQSWEVRRR